MTQRQLAELAGLGSLLTAEMASVAGGMALAGRSNGRSGRVRVLPCIGPCPHWLNSLL